MESPNRPKRINVVGTSGSGKSTVARQISEVLGCPCVHLDQLHWAPGWKPYDDVVFFANLERAIDCPTWVVDGNYDRTLHIKWRDVDTVVWVDYSFSRVLFQAVRRAIQRIITQEELWPGTGNRESFRLTFMSRDSVLLWTMTTYGKNRKRYEERMRDPQFSHIRFVRLRRPKDLAEFLKSLHVNNS